MERIVHYTSNKNWGKIKERGLLLPRTDPYWGGISSSDRVAGITQGKLFLVGMPDPLNTGWIKYGLMDYLLKHTSGEVVLNVPILEQNGAFAREHAHISPKTFLDKYGKDLWKEWWEGRFSFLHPTEKNYAMEACKDYVESTVRLNEYDGSYLVPEIWLPQETPISLLTKI